ncbi:hypothetical protein V1511DRAFT_507878 [Dipodascopsis uninucleata]
MSSPDTIAPLPQPIIASLKETSRSGSLLADDYASDHSDPRSVSGDCDIQLVHRWQNTTSILSLACSDQYLFAGTQGDVILVFDINTYEKKATLVGHGGSVLCLTVSKTRNLLFSGGSDSLLKIWSIDAMKEIYTMYSVLDVGDIFSIMYSELQEMIYIGSQNASIQWCNIKTIDKHASLDTSYLPSNRFSKFFNSTGPGGIRPSSAATLPQSVPQKLIEVPHSNVIPYAHNGFIYCLHGYSYQNYNDGITVEEYAISGGSDGAVNVWSAKNGSLQLYRSFALDNSVLCMTSIETFLYCGLSDGLIVVIDLDAMQIIKTSKCYSSDVLSLAAGRDFILAGSAAGYLKKFTRDLGSNVSWRGHDGLVLSTVYTMTSDKRQMFMTGSNDNSAALWEISEASHMDSPEISLGNDRLLQSLSRFVSFKTVSALAENRAECRRCATYLKSLLKKFGASSNLIVTEDNHNPIVYASFRANSKDKTNTSVLFYGHYDIIGAAPSDKWKTDPHILSGLNGYLYGRGVSDNKGPVLSAIFAAAELYQSQRLRNNIYFIIEGEEENGSAGFQEAISKSKHLFENEVDWIILSNSYWLDDEVPCLNYGLRGVIYLSIDIYSDHPDLHSGVDGGLFREPLMDMTKLLASLTDDNGKVLIPGYYDPVRPITDAEAVLYEQIGQKSSIKLAKESLMAKWRLPSLTIHGISVSGPVNPTIIPRSAKASISIRTVPDQETSVIGKSIVTYLRSKFESMGSPNHICIKINKQADAWLGNPENAAFKTLAKNVTKEWGVAPLYIREGGTIPAVRFLEKAFSAPAVQFPCGQSSDHAHLDNERLRVVNLYKSKQILQDTFNELPPRN